MKTKIQECSKSSFIIASKKLFVLALLLVGTTLLAQNGNKMPQRNKMPQFTPEQQTQLMLKKMTLALDLNDSQQKEMSALIADKIAKREAFKTEMKARKEKGVQPTNDERFAMQMKMLDEKMAAKKRMEKILSPKQLEKLASIKEDFKENRHERLNRNHQGRNQGKRQG